MEENNLTGDIKGPSEFYPQDISQMGDQSLASTVSSSSSDDGTDIKPQIREQFDRKCL